MCYSSLLPILEILETKNDHKDPMPVNQARDFYAACKDTSIILNHFINVLKLELNPRFLIIIEQLEIVGLKPLIDFLDAFGGNVLTLDIQYRTVTNNV